MRTSAWSSCARRSAWCSNGRIRCRISIYENVVSACASIRAAALNRRQLDECVEKALTRGVALGRPQGRLARARPRRSRSEQQQKLCIARLLPLKPEVILMDEPCSALDVEGTAAIEELMDRLRGRYTIVIVTHNMAQAAGRATSASSCCWARSSSRTDPRPLPEARRRRRPRCTSRAATASGVTR